MPDIYDLADKYRNELLRNERKAAARIVKAYGQVWEKLNTELGNLMKNYEPGKSWMAQYARIATLKAQVEAELRKFIQYAEGEIIAQQNLALDLVVQHTEQMILSELGVGSILGFDRLPREAFQYLVGFLQNGSPLANLLAELVGDGGQIVMNGLIQGLMLGQSAWEIARNIREGLGGNLARALRIARTETLRPYRTASLQTYRANSHIVRGWTWRSARNERTCGMCWAMDGTEHGLDEQLDDHPNGRCFMVPALIGKESGKETGQEAFEKLGPDEQVKILGPSKYAAWKDGRFSLPDLVGRKYDPQWGWMRYEKSLRELGIDWKKIKQEL